MVPMCFLMDRPRPVPRLPHGSGGPALGSVAHLHHVGSAVRLNPRAIFMRRIEIKRNQERTATTETNDLRPRDSTISGNDPSARTHWPIESRHFQHTAVMSDQTPNMPRNGMGEIGSAHV